MPKYSLLGATGWIVGEVLRVLLETSTNMGIKTQINTDCKIAIEIREAAVVRRIEGLWRVRHRNIWTKDVACITPSFLDSRQKTSFNVYSSFCKTFPSCSIPQDQAKAAVSAPEQLWKGTTGHQVPRLTVQSSAEADEEPWLSKDTQWTFRPISYVANSWLYNDLIEAERYPSKTSRLGWPLYRYVRWHITEHCKRPWNTGWQAADIHQLCRFGRRNGWNCRRRAGQVRQKAFWYDQSRR